MKTLAENPYLSEIITVLPRILAGIDRDPLSPTAGVCDRLHWAWKLQDYANATPQGAAHGLAQLVAASQLPEFLPVTSVLERIDLMIAGARRITARDGSLVEAFPNEKSFCVTALVAFDILRSADLLEARIGATQAARWRETAAPMIDFIMRNEETHAIISNHLATAVAALTRWRGAGAASAQARARQLLARILAHQSAEGWFSEYGGADPGYETLGLGYLADVLAQAPSNELHEALARSLRFLCYFAQPDGSFGGLIGARNTRFIVPAGLEELSVTLPDAARLARFARRAIARRSVVTLATLDEPNLAPNFNAYCRASAAFASLPSEAHAPLPCEMGEAFRQTFQAAGIIIDAGPRHYTLVSTSKGGVTTHAVRQALPAAAVPCQEHWRVRVNPGVAGHIGGKIVSSQAFNPGNDWRIEGDVLHVTSQFAPVTLDRPSPGAFIALRLLALTAFRVRAFTEFVKRRLVARLIARRGAAPCVNHRTIRLGEALKINDVQIPPDVIKPITAGPPFMAIHMASAGYWQRQDDQL